MLRFEDEFREKDLIFALVYQESAHLFRLLDLDLRQEVCKRIEEDVTVE